MNFVDTHCHLNTYEEFSGESFLELRKKDFIFPEVFINVACDPDDFEDAKKRSEEGRDVYSVYGVHPEAISKFDSAIKILPQYWNHFRCVGCGEFGLDYHYGKDNRKEQIQIFETQLERSLSTKKALVLHLRESEEDALSVLKNFPLQETKIHLHCFTSTRRFAEQMLSLYPNLYIGFTGIITFKNAENVCEAAAIVPLERLLLETDSPYLAPVPFRGKPSHGGMIPKIAEKLAEIKNEPLENLYSQIRENTRTVYGI